MSETHYTLLKAIGRLRELEQENERLRSERDEQARGNTHYQHEWMVAREENERLRALTNKLGQDILQLQQRHDEALSHLDDYGRTHPDLASACEAAVNDANHYRIENEQLRTLLRDALRRFEGNAVMLTRQELIDNIRAALGEGR